MSFFCFTLFFFGLDVKFFIAITIIIITFDRGCFFNLPFDVFGVKNCCVIFFRMWSVMKRSAKGASTNKITNALQQQQQQHHWSETASQWTRTKMWIEKKILLCIFSGCTFVTILKYNWRYYEERKKFISSVSEQKKN